MKKSFGLLVLFVSLYAFLPAANAQQKTPLSSWQEDCGVNFTFNAASSGAQAALNSAGTTPVVNNEQTACLFWEVSYSTDTTVTGVSLLLQTATDVAGVPGTWSGYPGTLDAGINPNTVVTAGGAVTEAHGVKYPFVRMNLTSYTGTGNLKGRLLGWKNRPISVSVASGGGCAGTVGTPCVVDGPTAAGSAPTTPPVLVAGWNGSTVQIPVTCNLNAVVNLSGSGNTQLVAVSGSTVIRVCKVEFASPAAQAVKLTYGTGSNCGTGTTDFSPTFTNAIAGVLPPVGSGYLPPTVPSGKALCFNQTVAQATGVWVFYAQY